MNNIKSINDLVIKVFTNGTGIKSKAGNSNALPCLQMGMINLLEINTSIDFKEVCSQSVRQCEHVIFHLFAMGTYLITNKGH